MSYFDKRTPPPPSADDVIYGQPLTLFYIALSIKEYTKKVSDHANEHTVGIYIPGNVEDYPTYILSPISQKYKIEHMLLKI